MFIGGKGKVLKFSTGHRSNDTSGKEPAGGLVEDTGQPWLDRES